MKTSKVTPASKLSRTESVQYVTPLPRESSMMEPEGDEEVEVCQMVSRPAVVAAAKTRSARSICDEEEEKDLPSTCPEAETDRFRKRAPSGPVTVSDIEHKMQTTSSINPFIPLSCGKFLSMLWWEPLSVRVLTKSLELTCRTFLNCSETVPALNDGTNMFEFRVSGEDLLKICYLRHRTVNLLHGENVEEFEVWQKVNESRATCDPEDTQHVAEEVFKREFLSSEITRIPNIFHLMFQKRPNCSYEGKEGRRAVPNLNSISCVVQGQKNIFKYDFVCCLMIGDVQCLYGRKKTFFRE